MRQDDRTRLKHMLDASTEAMAFSGQVAPGRLVDDRMALLAIVRCIEIVGEAASRLSKTFRDSHPEVPWPQVIGMRNRIVHAYFEIDAEVVAGTVRTDLPILIDQLGRILSEPD